MKKYFKRKPRIEKKFTKRAMELLLKLMPSQYKEDDFYLDVNEWCWGEFDYWGEFDSYDSFFELHKNLITMTTDWENLYRAGENNEDKTPYFSPWRINYKVGRREVISHCHKLVKAGVVWG
ncbi:hypothetical protein [Providencia rettgeri]|uniref:hypothetical protein n=1 Tax=Providencia rettgeri TaxID=587 RepID=UPI0018C71788|nr:hypothetical protein [Providencia rettgeri]MBG5923186.1 hypothetical protein [Providencia rettgeri]